MSWLLHRIDDRLIHGQVLVAWGQRLNPVRMWLVDDAVAAVRRGEVFAVAPDAKAAGGGALPYQLYLMLPYALSILALVLVARRAAYPQALMKPYRKGER